MTASDVLVSASQDGAIKLAVEKILAGELVVVPTETVYGLAADATNRSAVQKIYAAKGRPSFNPLICHVSSVEMASGLVELSDAAFKLAETFWPGPLTLVCSAKPNNFVADEVTAGLNTLAVRCPANAITRSLIAGADKPIAAPSANPSGKLSPTRAQTVLQSMGDRVGLILDDGPTKVGIESTIVAVEGSGVTLLRPGTITADDISEAAGVPVKDRDSKTITAPGQLASHYAPDAEVLLNQQAQVDGQTLIGFGQMQCDLNLSPTANLVEAASNLFEMLRQADQGRPIAVAPIPNKGVGIAINDRLKRAAATRPETPND